MAGRIQLRRGTAANWTAANPTLANGEVGVETDTGKLKVGNGSSTWASLPYVDAGAVDHIADTVDAHDASAISFAPTGTIGATDVQAAIAEVASESVQASALTTNGDVLTRAAGVPARITRADLASDSAFSSRYVLLASDDRVNGQVPVWNEALGEWVSQTATADVEATAVYFDGTTGNYASTPDVASLDITGDITVMAWIVPADTTPAATMVFAGKLASVGDQRAWSFSVRTDGTLGWQHSTAGTSATNISTVVSTAVPTYSETVGRWVAVTLDVNNGSSQYVTRFYEHTNRPGILPTPAEWTQVGTAVTRSGVTSIFNSSAPLEVGAFNVGTQNFIGRIARVLVCNDIGADGRPGTSVVADWRADLGVQSRYLDVTGKVWTMTGSAWSGTVADPLA